jgi:hypothetical protein
MLRRELQFVTDFFTTGVWADDVTGVAGAPSAGETKQWSDYASSDPIADIEAGKAEILGNTGMEANTLVLGYDVFKSLKNHPDLVDRIKYTSSQTITTDMLAAMFDIPRVMVAKAVKATNNEGASEAYGFAFGKGALLTHVAPNPGLLTPSACDKLGVPMEKVAVVVHETGNTSSASIPLALFGDFGQVKAKDGDLVLMVGFGAGMTAASAVVRWNAQ